MREDLFYDNGKVLVCVYCVMYIEKQSDAPIKSNVTLVYECYTHGSNFILLCVITDKP